jgi:DeoR family fructose operon transcriptional repressor
MSVSTEQRHEIMLSQVYDKGRVTVKNLVEVLDISEATVRRDLKTLAEKGQVELVYGGATLPRSQDFSFHSKGMRNIREKRIIGKLAADLISNNDQIFVDSGTTCFQMAPHLRRKRGLTIIANSARLAMELDVPAFSIILLGGKYRPDRMDTIGPLAIKTLENLRGYTAFIGADGLSTDVGLMASDIESAHLYSLAVANATKTALLVDHSKFLTPSLYKIVDFDSVSRVVTDKAPSKEWAAFLDGKNIEVIYPKGTQEQKS